MRELPILFSAPMVRAILEGRKMHTRRVVKPYRGMPIVNLAEAEPTLGFSGGFNDPASWGYEFLDDGAPAPLSAWPELCPYGQPGDRLWVRETWRYADWTDDGYPWIEYQADSAKSLRDSQLPPEWSERVIDIWAKLSEEENFAIDGRAADRKWRPSIHMPRWASRITLEVTGVRVERLQDISEADAIAEGCIAVNEGISWHTAADAFEALWNSINGPGSWDANPWVRVVAFKRVEVAGG
jgi:hypothetical protein